jgi:ATP-dependent Clp protease ATP-binding subunit ClpC
VILHERGLRLDKLREEVEELIREKAEGAAKGTAPGVSEKAAARPRVTLLLSEFTRDLTQSAAENELDPLIGREVELERVIRALCRRSRNNAVLVGEPGVGKKAIVRGLAQRIASDNVPSRLQGARLLIFDLSSVMAFARDAHWFEERFAGFLKELTETANVIFFIEDLFAMAGARRTLDEAKILKPLLTRGELQCIAAAAPGDYQKALEEEPWLKSCFNAVEVRPPEEAETLKILAGLKQRFEQFHSVTYTDEALQYAVLHSQRYLPGRFLPDKAIDLLDEAGAAAAVRAGTLPGEVIDAEKRLKFVVNRLENAVASQELEKAKFYSDEERKERENLGQLRAKYNLGATSHTVTLDDIENVVAQWTGLPIARIQQERGSPSAGGQAG